MSKPGLKRYILIYEDGRMAAVTAERFKLGAGVELFDQHGDCIAASPSSKLLLVVEEDHLEDLDQIDLTATVAEGANGSPLD